MVVTWCDLIDVMTKNKNYIIFLLLSSGIVDNVLIHGACFYTLIMAHVVLKATSVSLGRSGIHFFGA